jgi:integrase
MAAEFYARSGVSRYVSVIFKALSCFSAKEFLMRLKESFVLYKRKMVTGAVVFYYQCYDEHGKRLCGHSTGQRTKTAAKEYCNDLLRQGKLIPAPVPGGKMPSFEKFSQGWWEYDTCAYLRSRKGRRAITKNYADTGKQCLRTHLRPAFGKKRIDLITEDMVDVWLTSYEERGIKRNTANLAFKILKVMLGFAVTKKLIKYNPCANVQLLDVTDSKEVQILTVDEVRRLFPQDWSLIWKDKTHYILNMLACCTGMRLGELLGLMGGNVFDTYLEVSKQYNKYGLVDPKGHKARAIPFPPVMRRHLEELIEINGNKFLFSVDGGETPVGRHAATRKLHKALAAIGIDEAERKRRGLTMHGWRHFFNTTLVMANVSGAKIREVTGHFDDKMTQHYTHLDAKEFAEVVSVQQGLLTTE